MVARIPLVLGSDGLPQQLQAGDAIPAAMGYTTGTNSNGTWRKAPDGTVMQVGTITLSAGAGTITFPIAFPSSCMFVGLTPITSNTSAAISCYLTAAQTTTQAKVAGSVTTVGLSAGVTAATFSVEWFAIGN